MSYSDDGAGCFMLIVIAVLCVAVGLSCGQGYDWGYNAHRRDACVRSGGVWMQLDTSPSRRACVTGERR